MQQPHSPVTLADGREYIAPVVATKLPIYKYINYHSRKGFEGPHFYRVPVLRIKYVHMMITFDNPCVLCGAMQEADVHKVVGDARVRS